MIVGRWTVMRPLSSNALRLHDGILAVWPVGAPDLVFFFQQRGNVATRASLFLEHIGHAEA